MGRVIPFTALPTALLLPLMLALAAAACRRSGAGGSEIDAGEDGSLSMTDAFTRAPDDAALFHEADVVPSNGCATGADLVYVATEEHELYSFDPTKVSFGLVGVMDCANGAAVNSMAVDRNANAWVNYADGSLWEVSTHDATCTSTAYAPNQQGVGLFGMGFSAKTPGGTAETLFVCDLNGGGLGFIDLSSMTLELLGPFQGALAGRACELSGTADARLFGFFAGSPLGDAGSASVDQLDPGTESSLTSYPLPSVDTGSDWAFSFWGGDFYLYTADKYDENHPDSTVTRFRPSDGSVTILAQDIGFRIVGAGSSTCAPTAPIQ